MRLYTLHVSGISFISLCTMLLRIMAEPLELSYPHASIISPDNILVCDTYSNRISEYTVDGQFLRHLGTSILISG